MRRLDWAVPYVSDLDTTVVFIYESSIFGRSASQQHITGAFFTGISIIFQAVAGDQVKDHQVPSNVAELVSLFIV
jgi:hypothetical protein